MNIVLLPYLHISVITRVHFNSGNFVSGNVIKQRLNVNNQERTNTQTKRKEKEKKKKTKRI